jgi:hypothetical protein
MEKPEQDRRDAARRRVLKGAQIIFNDRAAVIDCVIRDLSEQAPALKWKAPGEFRIRLSSCLRQRPSAIAAWPGGSRR